MKHNKSQTQKSRANPNEIWSENGSKKREKKRTLHYFLSKLGTRALLPWKLLLLVYTKQEERKKVKPRSENCSFQPHSHWNWGSKFVGFVWKAMQNLHIRRKTNREERGKTNPRGMIWRFSEFGIEKLWYLSWGK